MGDLFKVKWAMIRDADWGRWPTTSFETGLCNATIFGKILGKFVDEKALEMNFLEYLCVHLKGKGPRIKKGGLNFS